MKSFVLTVAVCGVLCPVDVAIVINRQEPLRAAEQLSYAHISSLHVVVVPGMSLVSRAVHDSGKLLWGAVTVDHTHTAKQEDRVEAQSREQVLKVPCQHPFVHYSAMQWGSMNNILKCEMAICALSLSQATLCPLTCDPRVVTPPVPVPPARIPVVMSSQGTCGGTAVVLAGLKVERSVKIWTGDRIQR